ncbi:MAG: superoxide dismutase [bacterium]|nr:superoxide dismutase [bacterium]
MPNNFILPDLPYGYGELEPVISAEQLKLHHNKHHAAYVNGANAIFEKLDRARGEQAEIDVKAIAKELAFNAGGHVLHSLFWRNLAPAGKGGEPDGKLAEMIKQEFGSLGRLKQEFSQAALSVEGSGWAGLGLCPETGRLTVAQIEKHNVNLIPELKLILVLDVWEHAYYLDYKNERAKFIDAFWRIVNWPEAAARLKAPVT